MVEKHDPLLQEINEAVRQERYANLWNKYRLHVLGIVGALVVVTAGVSVERELSRQAAADYTQRLLDAKQLLEAEQYNEAIAAFNTIANNQRGDRKAIAVLWKAFAERASNAPESANGTLRNYAEQADAGLWRDIVCLQLFASESIPDACSGATDGAFASLLRTHTASKLALEGEWEKASALLKLVAESPDTPRGLAAQATQWRSIFITQQAKAAMAAVEAQSEAN